MRDTCSGMGRTLAQIRLAALAALIGCACLASADGWAQTSVNGMVFADFTDKESKDQATGSKSADSGAGTDVKRFFLTVTSVFDSVWSAQFQTDIGDQGTRRYDVFVKRAYVQAKLAPELSLRLGSAPTPWVPFLDEIYGFRYVEQVLIDRLLYGTSCDWGFHLLGKAAGDTINYAAAALNGRGFSNPTRSKSVDFEGRLGFESSGLNLAVGGYSGKRGLDTSSMPALHNATRGDAVAAYVSDRVRAGGEFFEARNWFNVTTPATDRSDGFSGWLSWAPTGGGLTIFGRYDRVKPSKLLNPGLVDEYYNAGLQWRFNPAAAACLAYKHEEVRNGILTTGNGTVGSLKAGGSGRYQEVGIWTTYTF